MTVDNKLTIHSLLTKIHSSYKQNQSIRSAVAVWTGSHQSCQCTSMLNEIQKQQLPIPKNNLVDLIYEIYLLF